MPQLIKTHFFFFNDTATTEIYTLSLHDALPISHRLSRPSVLQDARAVEAEDDQAGGPERHQQRGESPVEPESGGPNGGGDEPGDAREEAQDHDFLPRHEDAEHVAPAEPAHGEEHQAVP